MKILVFTSLFPNNIQPYLGVFIKERIVKVAELCEVKIVAPVPYFPSFKIFKKWYPFSQIKKKDALEGLEIFHPRYFIIPKIGMVFYGLFMFLSVLKTVVSIQKEFDFDLIDAHYVYPDGFAAVLLGKVLKKPMIISARGTDINLYSEFFIIRREIIYALRNAVKVIAVSQSLKERMVKLGIPAGEIKVISNGVDIQKFKPVAKEKIRKELGLPRDRKIVISVGHLVENKGFHYLIEAFSDIKGSGCKDNMPLLLIVGDGIYRKKLKNKIKEMNLENDVILTGAKFHSELYRWYSAADLFCLASSHEGWPNVIFEALACGKPAVATKVGGIPEIIKSDEYGFLVGKLDPQELAAKIKKALDKNWDCEKLIAYATANTWRKKAEEIFREFDKVVNAHG